MGLRWVIPYQSFFPPTLSAWFRCGRKYMQFLIKEGGGQNRIEILLGLAEGRPTYACVLPMILSYLCLWATLQKSYRWFWATLVPMPLATYTFNLLYLYLCIAYLCCRAFELPMSSAFLCFRDTNAVELHMFSSYLCLRATYAFDLALRLPFRMPALLSYLCLQSSYAFEVPMQLSFLCLRATYAFELPMFSSYLCF